MAQAMIMRLGDGRNAEPQGPPEYTYTGDSQTIDDGNNNWRIKFLTSGTFTPKRNLAIDLFLVGGGASGSSGSSSGANFGGGGGGGYTATHKNIVCKEQIPYTITIGAGGVSQTAAGGNVGNAGGNTSFDSFTVSGGKVGSSYKLGGNGGSGGGYAGTSTVSRHGGSDGGHGGSEGDGGTGQGTTTREFAEPTGDLYAGGGGAGGGSSSGTGGDGGGGKGGSNTNNSVGGKVNTGGGGGGGTSNDYGDTVYRYGRYGGSGIVIIRNARSDKGK